ncbi:N-acetyltransferase [Streptomyces nitrosporeus]|uniref:N-acetyltransferase n=1 Tax=Streptomyces nitrosporeus TaxID=28894 RepID=A0A5J6F7K6_9ACTN|nr:N-acetyltransferase [Streptomyces nitrosporeus]
MAADLDAPDECEVRCGVEFALRSGATVQEFSVFIAEENAFDPEEMLSLYASVGWEGYTKDIGKLCRGLLNSHLVITARDGSGTLLGLARTISDDEHICYVQDVVVNPRYHRQGIGRALIEDLMPRYSHCRFFLLSTDHESAPEGKRNHAFYRSLGFLSYEEKEMAGFGLPRNRPDLRDMAP